MLRPRSSHRSRTSDRFAAGPMLKRGAFPYRSLAAPAILLSVALMLGGGGTTFPLTELIVEIIGLAVLLLELWEFRWNEIDRPTGLGLLLLALILLVPLIQLIPLPPAIWTNLPGRDFERDASRVLGSAAAFRPLSLDPDMTLRSLLALIPAAAMFLAALRLTAIETRYLLLLLVGMAMCSVLLGMLQAAAGAGSNLYLYESSHQGLATGFFANRNHQGDFLVVACIAAAALAADARHSIARKRTIQRIVLISAMALCVVGTLATASRTASFLVVLAILLTLPWLVNIRLRTGFLLLLGALALVSLLYYTDGVEYIIKRYQNTEDARFEFWPDTLYAIRLYFPAGSGLGTFDPVFRSIEQLSIVGPHYVNDAHNDFLQVTLETGIAGPVLFVLLIAYLTYAGWRLRRRQTDPLRRFSTVAAIYGILLLVIHCFVDYPLRTLALETLFALLGGQIVAALREPSNPDGEERALPEK